MSGQMCMGDLCFTDDCVRIFYFCRINDCGDDKDEDLCKFIDKLFGLKGDGATLNVS